MTYFKIHQRFLEKFKKLKHQPQAKQAYKAFIEEYKNKTINDLKADSEIWFKSRRIYIPPITKMFILYFNLIEREDKVIITEIYNSRSPNSLSSPPLA